MHTIKLFALYYSSVKIIVCSIILLYSTSLTRVNPRLLHGGGTIINDHFLLDT